MMCFGKATTILTNTGCGSRVATLTIVFKLSLEAQKTWKKLKGYKLIPLVLKDTQFIDGELQEEVT